MDFISNLPKVGETATIITIVGRFSKYIIFVPAPKYTSVEEIAKLFFNYVVKYWDMPKNIISDWNSRFTVTFWFKLFKLLGSQLNMLSSYHPEIDEQIKCFNSMLEEYLRHFVKANQCIWVQFLNVVQLYFCAQKSESSGMIPFEMITGQQPLLPHILEGPYILKFPRAFQFARDWHKEYELVHAYLNMASYNEEMGG